ncbi:hypothetical protein Tco_1054623 [Tanacetum coccineum]|uniref:DUF4283 domain-containing protein n=1 Tax=Tanacetum coccineum TaxID=301880 RepID=A0ABQ5GXB0_9ASTR
MLKSGFLGLGGGDEKEKKKDTSLADQTTENGNVVYSDNGVDQNTQFDQNTNGSANDVTKRHVLTANDKGPLLFAKLVSGEPSRKLANFCTLLWPTDNGADVVVSLEFVRAISERFANSVYGFFLGKRIAYPVFSSKERMDAMLENNPWFIRNTPPILKKWTLNANLLEEDVGNVSVWMLDSYTSAMCMESWDRLSFARTMIELGANVELKDIIVVYVPKLIGEGFSMCSIRVEYEWKPSRCSTCKLLEEFSSKKKQAKVTRQEVSNSNPFDALNSVENDDDLGTNGENSKLSEAFGSPTTTPLTKRINNPEIQMLDWKLVLVDDDGKPLKSLNTGSGSGYGTKSLLEQWRETTVDDDYDPHDDDVYEGHDISENLQDVCHD